MTYARGVADALRVVGRRPRGEVLHMLRDLGLSHSDAEHALRYALRKGLLVAEEGSVRSG